MASDLRREEEDLLWLGGVGDFPWDADDPFYTVRVLREALDQFNETLLEVCATRGVECLDLSAQIPGERPFFVDDVHFTELGARRAAEEIARFLATRPPFRL